MQIALFGPPTLRNRLWAPPETDNALFSADPDVVSAQIDLIGVPWLMIGEESSAAPQRRISHVDVVPSVTTRDRDSRHRAVRDAARAEPVSADACALRAELTAADRCQSALGAAVAPDVG